MGGYQLKVGGVVVGSWAKGSIMGLPNRNNTGNAAQARRVTASSGNVLAPQLIRCPISSRQARMPMNSRLQRVTGPHVTSIGRTIAKNTYGNNKVNRQRNRNRQRKSGTENKSIFFLVKCNIFIRMLTLLNITERKNPQQAAGNSDNNKIYETKTISETDATKYVNANYTEIGNG